MLLSIIDDENLLDDPMHQKARRRFLFALSRYDSCTEEANIAVSTVAALGSGLQNEYECQVTVQIQGASDASHVERDIDLTKCISRAAERTGRAVGRSILHAGHLDRFRRFTYGVSSFM